MDWLEFRILASRYCSETVESMRHVSVGKLVQYHMILDLQDAIDAEKMKAGGF